MRALIIGPEETAAIKDLMQRASARTVSLEETMKRSNDKAYGLRVVTAPDYIPTFGLEIPNGYRVIYTVETQPGPVVCRHISISVEGDAAPNPAAVDMLLQEFGFKRWFALKLPMVTWIEKLPPEKKLSTKKKIAVNVVEPIDGDYGRWQTMSRPQ